MKKLSQNATLKNVKRIVLFVGILALFSGAVLTEVFAKELYDVRLMVQITTAKHEGNKWDKASVAPPDVYGKVIFPGKKYKIPLHKNTYTLSLNYEKIALEQGEKIEIELFDRDRLRRDDYIGKGTIIFEGQENIKVEIGFAVVTFHFVKRLK